MNKQPESSNKDKMMETLKPPTRAPSNPTRKRPSANGFFSPLMIKRQTSLYSVRKQELRSKRASTKNPYRYDRVPIVATFHRDEIVTGAPLSLAEHHHQHHHEEDIFQFYDVVGIHIMHDHADATEGMTDHSSSSRHDDQDAALHHRQFPPAPSVVVAPAVDAEDARSVIQAQTQATTTTGKNKRHGRGSSKPLHKYMIKQVHPKCSNPQQAQAHLVHETSLWKTLGHQHYNLLTLRGTDLKGDNSIFASQWDSHFLLTDRISETLAQRLERWKDPANHSRMDSSGSGKTMSSKAQIDTSCLGFRMKLVYAQNLANVLSFLHSKRIAVRNLSPASIGFLASDDTLQLMDLGQAIEIDKAKPHEEAATQQQGSASATAMLQQQNQHALFQMTPGGQPFRYMAPELLTTLHTTQQAYYGTNVDCYSWSMICFEMITLHQPFGKMKAGQHLKQVALRNPSLRPHLEVYQLPKGLELALKCAWRQDANLRLEAAQIDRRMKQLLNAELHQSKLQFFPKQKRSSQKL